MFKYTYLDISNAAGNADVFKGNTVIGNGYYDVSLHVDVLDVTTANTFYWHK